jgi:hypothetical protein
VRIEIRPTGGTSFYVLPETTVTIFQLPFSDSALYDIPFTAQGLFNVPAGEVTIMPQIYSVYTGPTWPGWSPHDIALVAEA